VPRFRCLDCGRGFSSQTFRVDYGLRKPWLDASIARLFCAKVSLRRGAELLGVRRPTLERRLERFGRHGKLMHEAFLARHKALRGGLAGTFQLDELETFETDRRLQPVTVPVLIERGSFFLVHVDTAPLAARGGLSDRDEVRKKEWQALHGTRVGQSRTAVRHTLEAWRRWHNPVALPQLQSDKKNSYRTQLRAVFGTRGHSHQIGSSKATRDYRNLLFPINHTNAMLRDHVSRLVRRSWAHSKKRLRLTRHLWVFVLFRNYVRGITRKAPEVTSAMALGVAQRKYGWSEVLRWRAEYFFGFGTHGKGPDSCHRGVTPPT